MYYKDQQPLDVHYKSVQAPSVNLHTLPYEKQDPAEGRMYFFMHKNLRDFVIDIIKKDSE